MVFLFTGFRQLLENGYAVLFFHRTESLKPYSRKFGNLFEKLEVDASGTVNGCF